jgi:hypothetical protein
MKHEDRLADIIKYVNENHSSVLGMDKVALLKTAAAYFEFATQAEATKEAMLAAFRNINAG